MQQAYRTCGVLGKAQTERLLTLYPELKHRNFELERENAELLKANGILKDALVFSQKI